MQYAKPVTLNVEESTVSPFCLTCLATIFCMPRRCVRAGAKNDAGISGRLLALHRLPDGGGYMMPDGDRFHLVTVKTGLTARSAPMPQASF